MTRLDIEHRRLYLLPDADAAEASRWLGRDGRVRAMVLGVAQPANWAALSVVWRGVQTDVEWPAPAIAVNGVDAFELWFSLAEPVPASEAAAVLQGLCERYLADVKPARLRKWPTADGAPWSAARIPALQVSTGGWSAFVAPDLPAVFGDEPLLDFQPGDDAQAELLGRLASIRPVEWQAAQAALAADSAVRSGAVPSTSALAALAGAERRASPASAALNGPYQDPRSFLLDVMNDPSVSLELRIRAAKALLTA